VETNFIPRKIDRCPECDSEKIVFPKSRGKKKDEAGGINWGCSDCRCAGFQSGCVSGGDKGGDAIRKCLSSTRERYVIRYKRSSMLMQEFGAIVSILFPYAFNLKIRASIHQIPVFKNA
jgi:hypothetical protein